MPIINTRRGRRAAQLPTERVIQIGRKRVRAFPERLDYFAVSRTSPAGDEAGNREIDDELCARLLEDQREHAPELPSDKLRSIRVFLAPEVGGPAFDSEFRCRTEDRYAICRGDGETARWLRGVDDAGALRPQPACLTLADPLDAESPTASVVCDGQDCPYYGRTTPDGKKQVFPRCSAEWTLQVQIALLDSVFGVARLSSSSIVGLEDTSGVLAALDAMVAAGQIPSRSAAPLRLVLKNTSNNHSKAGAWSACLTAPGTALALLEAAQRAYDEGRQLGAAPAPKQLSAAEPRVLLMDESEAIDRVKEEVTKTLDKFLPDAPRFPAPDGDEERSECYGDLKHAALELAGGDEALARAAMRRVLSEATDTGLPAWRKEDGAVWMLSDAEWDLAVECVENAVIALSSAAAQAEADSAAEEEAP